MTRSPTMKSVVPALRTAADHAIEWLEDIDRRQKGKRVIGGNRRTPMESHAIRSDRFGMVSGGESATPPFGAP